MTQPSLRIAVIGAGIGGLTATFGIEISAVQDQRGTVFVSRMLDHLGIEAKRIGVVIVKALCRLRSHK